MKFDLELLDGNRKEMTKIFLAGAGHECGKDGVRIEYHESGEERIKAEYDGKRVSISGKKDVRLYRGLHLFLQKIQAAEKEAFLIQESCPFSEKGIMVDCSRNGTLSTELLKELIRLCAACGLDQIYLYMEDVYEIPEEPYFGAFRGRYTYEELRGLDEYGRRAGVELIPAIQTLAHLHTFLKWPAAKNLRDTEDILLTGSEDTERFVRLMVKNAAAPFSSRKIHVGMDEADLLGLGRYLKLHGFRERYTLMTEHLNMVYRICREEDLRVMMWSDMFFRLKSPTGDYYDLPEDTEFDLEGKLPEDLELVYWDYYQHDRGIYDKNIRLHKKITDRLRFAGGGWTWNGIAPNYSKAEKTLREGIASCKEQGIDKVLCTFWFDNGTETPVRTALYPVLYFAQLCYNKEAEEEATDRWLIQFTGYRQREHRLLDEFDRTKGALPDNQNADNPSKYVLYQDVLAGLFDGQIDGEHLDEHYRALKEKLGDLGGRNREMDKIFSYYLTLAEVLAEKSMVGIQMRKAYQTGQKEILRSLKEKIAGCAPKLADLKEKRKEIWFEECRPFGFEVLDIRLGGVKTRMESAVIRIEDYLSGRADKLEELEEQTLVYNKDLSDEKHKMCMGGFWENIVSAGNISGI